MTKLAMRVVGIFELRTARNFLLEIGGDVVVLVVVWNEASFYGGETRRDILVLLFLILVLSLFSHARIPLKDARTNRQTFELNNSRYYLRIRHIVRRMGIEKENEGVKRIRGHTHTAQHSTAQKYVRTTWEEGENFKCSSKYR